MANHKTENGLGENRDFSRMTIHGKECKDPVKVMASSETKRMKFSKSDYS